MVDSIYFFIMKNTKNANHYDDIHNLDPITKFTQYGKFPMKMFAHIALVIFTTLQVVLLVSQTNQYFRAQEQIINDMFIGSSNKLKKLYTPKQVRQLVIDSVKHFYSINEHSLEITSYDSDDPVVVMDVIYYRMNFSKYNNIVTRNDNSVNREYLNEYILNKDYFGPFGNDTDDMELKYFLNSISSFNLNYTFKTYIPNEYTNSFDCNLWKIYQIFSFESHSHFDVKLTIDRYNCNTSNITTPSYLFAKLIWIHFLVFIFASYSLYTTWKYISEVASLFIRVRTKNKVIAEHSPESDNSIYFNPLIDAEQDEYRESYQRLLSKPRSSSKKSMSFNKWALICLLGNIIQIFASLISIFDYNHLMIGTEILIGFGCFFAYLYMGRYLEYAAKYSTVYVTITKSLPNVCRYLISVAPLFIGFMLFGICVFWRSLHFSSLSNAMIVLFSLANGDVIHDTLNELKGIYFVMGQLYLYSFCIIFIVVVLNIFIAIVQEAYSNSQTEAKEHWAMKDQNIHMENAETSQSIKAKLDAEMSKILNKSRQISLIASEMKKNFPSKIYKEVSMNIREYIDENIINKIEEIKSLIE